jgi:hypothetical protein
VEDIHMRILVLEEQLRQAMLKSDVAALDSMLSPDLMFTNHVGQVLGKAEDLNAHRAGLVKLDSLVLTDSRVKIFPGAVVVNVRVHMAGSYAGARHEGDFRFTRVWAEVQGKWQVVAGHSGMIVSG